MYECFEFKFLTLLLKNLDQRKDLRNRKKQAFEFNSRTDDECSMKVHIFPIKKQTMCFILDFKGVITEVFEIPYTLHQAFQVIVGTQNPFKQWTVLI